MGNDYLERRIATLERTVFPLPHLVDQLGAQIGQTAQQIRGVRSGGGFCITHFNGVVAGNPTIGAVAVPGCTINVKGFVTGADYGTYDAGNGNFDLYVSGLDAATEGGKVNLFVQGPGPRFGLSGAIVATFTQCQSASASPLTLRCAPATGYRYWKGPCNFPIAETLNWASSLHGTGTFAYFSGSDSWQTGGIGTFPTYAFSVCPARPAIPLSFATYGAGSTAGTPSGCFSSGFPADATFHCPLSGGSFGGIELYSVVLIASPQCPDATTLKLDMTYTVIGGTGVIFGPSNQTFRIYEP